MSSGPESLLESSGRALAALGARDPKLLVLDAESPAGAGSAEFRTRFPDRYATFDPAAREIGTESARRSAEGRTVFACGLAAVAMGPAYASVRRAIGRPRANVKIVASHGSLLDSGDTAAPPMLEDIGLMRGLPGMAVVVPADAPSAESATLALAELEGPAYLRLTRQRLLQVTDGSMRLGRAPTLRDGGDLTIVSVGAMVARSLELARDLAKVGVSARVLDLASVKPFDEAALLRAARDTGAILVAEEHTVLTGVGALVASVTAENYPVPVRRVGVPDLFGESAGSGPAPEEYGLSLARMTEEAWELLRLRGKVE
jgi:transketolase